MKKIIFFRNDRLGDFIILTNLIKSIKNKYKDSQITVLCSPLNYNFIKKCKIVDEVIVYSKAFSLLAKIKILRKILNSNYFASFAVDGKSFSNFCNFFISSKYKFGLVYKYKLLNLWFSKPNFLYNYFVFNKFEIFTSKKNLTKIEHLPTKFIRLGNFLGLNLKITDNYYFETNKNENLKFNKFKIKNLQKKFILIHLDEKWKDIALIDSDLFINLLYFQKKIRKQLVITSFNNHLNYFKNLKKNIQQHKTSKNILIIENSNLFFFERLINASACAISCHSGFLVQIAGANSTNLIDIINKQDYKWYSSWKPKNTRHKFVFKSYKFKEPINSIFKKLIPALSSYLK
tara:strand:- start:1816 stop:2853 length:1038 start_codon:yes stop_codon:yes gene_type:complete